MPEPVTVYINGAPYAVPAHHTVAAVLANLGIPNRRSITGNPRGPLCGMGTCHECRVTLDGQLHQRSCETVVREGMEIRCDA